MANTGGSYTRASKKAKPKLRERTKDRNYGEVLVIPESVKPAEQSAKNPKVNTDEGA